MLLRHPLQTLRVLLVGVAVAALAAGYYRYRLQQLDAVLDVDPKPARVRTSDD